jgi:hypothetical protein
MQSIVDTIMLTRGDRPSAVRPSEARPVAAPRLRTVNCPKPRELPGQKVQEGHGFGRAIRPHK